MQLLFFIILPFKSFACVYQFPPAPIKGWDKITLFEIETTDTTTTLTVANNISPYASLLIGVLKTPFKDFAVKLRFNYQ